MCVCVYVVLCNKQYQQQQIPRGKRVQMRNKASYNISSGNFVYVPTIHVFFSERIHIHIIQGH